MLMDSKAPFPHFTNEWNPIFAQRRELVYSQESKRAIYDDFGPSTSLTTQEVITRFLNYRCVGDIGRYLHRNSQILNCLKYVDVESLRRGVLPDSTSPVAFIDDRNNISSTSNHPGGNRRLSRGPMSANQFYIELCKNRYDGKNPKEPNAERRLIYIANGNPACLLALLETVSTIQAEMVRNFLERKLSSSAFLAVEIPTIGLPTFALEFHFPYLAWRRAKRISKGSSDSSKGLRLQHDQQFTCLNPGRDEEFDDGLTSYLLEVKLSIMVCGIDNSFWTAYCFEDDALNDEDRADYMHHYYQEDLDLITGGRGSMSSPIWDPRVYFLHVLSYRILQIREEWTNAISELLKHIEKQGHEMYQKPNRIQDESYKWRVKTLRRFSNILSKTTDCWETFNQFDIHYFYTDGSRSFAEPLFNHYWNKINREFLKVRALKRELERQTEIFETMPTNLATHAAWVENCAMRQQNSSIQALGLITIFYLPANLASSIYSMPPSIFAEAITISDYIHTILGLTFVTLLLTICLPHLMKFWKLLVKQLTQICQRLFGLLARYTARVKSARSSRVRIDEERLEMKNHNFTAGRAR